MKNILVAFFLFISLFTFGQKNKAELEKLELYNDSIQVIIKNLYESKTDENKQKWNTLLISTFETCLKLPNSFNFPFDSITNIAILTSPDKTFKIINWNVPYNSGTHSYHGFIQKKQKKVIKKGTFKKEVKEIILLFPLIDNSANIRNAENYVSDNKRWFGMLYYKIIPKKTKSKMYYTLLAWDGNDKFSTKKIIDVLSFNKNGTPKFGAYLFNMKRLHQKRVIFEYSKDCTMSLKYDEKKDSIIFDHLVPTQEQLAGQYQYYCPDLGLDGFGFKRGKWNFATDVLARNEKMEQDKYYVDPREKTTAKESDNFAEKLKKNKKR